MILRNLLTTVAHHTNFHAIEKTTSMIFSYSQNQPNPDDDYFVPKIVTEGSPYFPQTVFETLPECLRTIFQSTTHKQEKDVILLGALTIISGCLPNTRGIYDNRYVYPNLYTFIDAPAGSGKGVLNFLRYLAEPIHHEKRQESRKLWQEYEQQKAEIKKEKGKSVTEIKEPPSKMLLIPANNSASSFIQTLNDNDGSGILFATEADTLTNSLAQDWGNFSDVMRCAFHHETVEVQRKTNKEYISISCPRLSIFLTGTLGQLQRLIPDTENGLFSRFMYYSMKSIPEFRNVFQKRTDRPGQEFKDLGMKLHETYKKLIVLKNPVEFVVDTQYQEKFVLHFNNLIKQYHFETGDRILATIHRIGLITFRISIIFTILKNMIDEQQELLPINTIEYIDFRNAVWLSERLIQMSLLHMADMPENKSKSIKSRRINQLLEKLPTEFKRKEANTISKELNIPPSTLTRYLTTGPFESTGYGRYRKLKVS